VRLSIPSLRAAQLFLPYNCAVPAPKETRRSTIQSRPQIRVNLHHGKIEDAVVRAVIHDDDGTKLQVDVVGLDLTALIDARQVVE